MFPYYVVAKLHFIEHRFNLYIQIVVQIDPGLKTPKSLPIPFIKNVIISGRMSWQDLIWSWVATLDNNLLR